MKWLQRYVVMSAFVCGIGMSVMGALAVPVAAQATNRSHLSITSTVPVGGTSLDPVINNQIVVELTATDITFNNSDSGPLTLTPGNTPPYAWNCHHCSSGFFTTVQGCPINGGCGTGDVQSWLVGVILPNSVLGDPDSVRYDIDSNNLGNGLQFASGPSCSTSVTPQSATYTATDGKAGWDAASLCSNNGVAINLDYQ